MFNSKRETLAVKSERTARIIALLKKEYPRARCSLIFRNPWQLLVATRLSAQCTDVRVNLVTPELFKHFATPQDFARARKVKLESLIRSTGFFRAKTKSLIAAAQSVVTTFNGKVPRTMGEMLTLPGVGRKSANVILGNAYGIPSGIAVDTHVLRLSKRLGLSHGKSPEKVEEDLMRLVPKRDWILFPHLIIWHGRRICQARKPKCGECVLNRICPSSSV